MSEAENPMFMKPGRVGWNELATKDTKAAGAFYGKLFGWHATPFVPKGAPAGGPPYTLFKLNPADEMGVGGMMQTMEPGAPSMWIPYVVVGNVDESLKKAAELGAKVCLPVTSIGEVGRIAVIQDPQGATLGLHELPKG